MNETYPHLQLIAIIQVTVLHVGMLAYTCMSVRACM